MIRPAPLAARGPWEGAKVSGQVTSQINTRPPFHGMSVVPSRRFLSDLYTPECSRWTGVSIDVKSLFRSSLSAA